MDTSAVATTEVQEKLMKAAVLLTIMSEDIT